jgi:hypothetical protein
VAIRSEWDCSQAWQPSLFLIAHPQFEWAGASIGCPPNREVGCGVGRVGCSNSQSQAFIEKKIESALLGSKLERVLGFQDESPSIQHILCPGNLGTWQLVLTTGADVAAEDWVGHAAGEAFGQAGDLAVKALEPSRTVPSAKLLDHGAGCAIQGQLHSTGRPMRLKS